MANNIFFAWEILVVGAPSMSGGRGQQVVFCAFLLYRLPAIETSFVGWDLLNEEWIFVVSRPIGSKWSHPSSKNLH